jgi:hypothetical protein
MPLPAENLYRPPSAPNGGESSRPNGAGTPTDTSSPGGLPIDPDAAVKVIIGIIGIVCVAATLLARARNREFRRPNPGQREDIAAPLARIAMRRADLSRWPDLVDAVDAGTATAAYLTDGPLTAPLTVTDPGVPPDLSDEEYS